MKGRVPLRPVPCQSVHDSDNFTLTHDRRRAAPGISRADTGGSNVSHPQLARGGPHVPSPPPPFTPFTRMPPYPPSLAPLAFFYCYPQHSGTVWMALPHPTPQALSGMALPHPHPKRTRPYPRHWHCLGWLSFPQPPHWHSTLPGTTYHTQYSGLPTSNTSVQKSPPVMHRQ